MARNTGLACVGTVASHGRNIHGALRGVPLVDVRDLLEATFIGLGEEDEFERTVIPAIQLGDFGLVEVGTGNVSHGSTPLGTTGNRHQYGSV